MRMVAVAASVVAVAGATHAAAAAPVEPLLRGRGLTVCEKDCYDLSCDDWGIQYGMTCDAMEAGGCSCEGCACATVDTTPLAATPWAAGSAAASTTTTTASEDGCSVCFNLTCDAWGASLGIPCAEVEEHGCSCAGCACALDTTTAAPAATTTTEEPVTVLDTCITHDCIRGHSCDRLEALPEFGYNCLELESEHECDCTGCTCAGPLGDGGADGGGGGGDAADTTSEEDTCDFSACVRGHTCDFIVRHGSIDFTCHALESFYECDCAGCSCPGEPETPAVYCQVGNTSDTVKCVGVDSVVMANRLECEIAAIAAGWQVYAWSESKLRCQLMNSTRAAGGNCRNSSLADYVLFKRNGDDDGNCEVEVTKNHDVIDALHELYANVTTPPPCDRDCFNTFDYEYNDAAFCAGQVAAGNSCEDYFCEDCAFAGFCDMQCGFCANGCAVELTVDCTDAFDTHYGLGTCQSLVEVSGYECRRQFCHDTSACEYAGYCDLTCQYCHAPVCQNAAGWLDAEGMSCQEYFARMWCDSDGQPGLGWDARWGDLADWASDDGVSPLDACCACGGGARCDDDDSDGLCNSDDSCPDDSLNDLDADMLCYDVDSCPTTADNNCAHPAPTCPEDYQLGRAVDLNVTADVFQTSVLLSITECAAQCDATAACVAVRFSSNSLLCEMLSTFHYVPADGNGDGNDSTFVCSVANATAPLLGFEEVVVATADYNDSASSGACRQYPDRLSYVADGSFYTLERSDLQECASECGQRADCLGFEFSYLNTNCELWKVRPTTVYPLSNYLCYAKVEDEAGNSGNNGDDGGTTVEAPADIMNGVLMAAGSDAGPYGVFNAGLCPEHWAAVGTANLDTCRAAVAPLGVDDMRLEWEEGNPAGCYLDVATDTLVFNYDGVVAKSAGVHSSTPQLLVCELDGRVATSTDAARTTTTAAPKCTWSDEQPQTYLSGCTDDLCFQYKAFEDATAACEAFGGGRCGGVTSVSLKKGVSTGYQTRSGTKTLPSKQASSSWVYSCGDLETLCGPTCFGFSCDQLEAMQNTYTCALMENAYDCDCAHCACKSEQPVNCKATCFGESCDAWISRGLGFSCESLESDYKCDCSECVCAA